MGLSICLALTDADWSLTKDVFSIIGTIISGSAVGVAYYFGQQGLHTWRRQLRGSADHDLARRLLIELYKLRDEIQRARSPAIFSFEGVPFEGEVVSDEPKQSSYAFNERAYRRRLAAMDHARNPLQATMLEAEAIWGPDLKGLMEKVFKLEREFVIYVRLYLMSIKPEQTLQGALSRQELLGQRRNVLYDLDSPDDIYWVEMIQALQCVENHLRERLIPS
ncbi:hypothetical protein HV782_011035 [Pseudomonas monsensis]|uniref:hypothetical protein n=1 Tax=Pseudomonas monsensis TaxID=2745509 RepID=UPI001648D658|nr:hypothetical protein [Pseudomonas monsensis]QXI02487.1 hypothetical protein HV782_011035 [Pseudomonas monsensis]